MKLATLVTLLAAAVFGNDLTAAQIANSTDFTCVVIQYQDNGCNATDFDLIGDMVAKLFYTELNLNQVVYVDTVGHKEEVYSMSTTTTTKTYDVGNRKLTSICQKPGYCDSNPTFCAAYGCPGYRRRLSSMRALQSGTFNMANLAYKGAAMLHKLPTTNPNCRPKELGFQCQNM